MCASNSSVYYSGPRGSLDAQAMRTSTLSGASAPSMEYDSGDDTPSDDETPDVRPASTVAGISGGGGGGNAAGSGVSRVPPSPTASASTADAAVRMSTGVRFQGWDVRGTHD